MKAVRYPVAGGVWSCPSPRPQAGAALIKVKAAGICASDVGTLQGKYR